MRRRRNAAHDAWSAIRSWNYSLVDPPLISVGGFVHFSPAVPAASSWGRGTVTQRVEP